MLLISILLFACLDGSSPDDYMENWFIREFSPVPVVTAVAWPGDGLPLTPESLRSDTSIMYGILRRDGSMPVQVLFERLKAANPDSPSTIEDVKQFMQKLMWRISVPSSFHDRLALIVTSPSLEVDSNKFRTAVFTAFQKENFDIPRVAIHSISSDWTRYCIRNPNPSGCFRVICESRERWVLSTPSILELLREKETGPLISGDSDRIYNTVRLLVAIGLQSGTELDLAKHVNQELMDPVSPDTILHVEYDLMQWVSIRLGLHENMLALLSRPESSPESVTIPDSMAEQISPPLLSFWFKYCIEPLRRGTKRKPCVVVPGLGVIRLAGAQRTRYLQDEEKRLRIALEIP